MECTGNIDPTTGDLVMECFDTVLSPFGLSVLVVLLVILSVLVAQWLRGRG